MTEGRQPLHLLALGASFTAGYYQFGLAYHPYAKHLAELFASVQISAIIDDRDVSDEQIVPKMVERLETLLESSASSLSAKDIFHQGLKLMYEMVLHRTPAKTKLVLMTFLQISSYPSKHKIDKKREVLNKTIRNYVKNHDIQERVCLVDLDKAIQYHSMKDSNERDLIWDDGVHLTPAGYNQMATVILEAMKSSVTI